MVAEAYGDGRPLCERVRSDSVRILIVGAAGMVGRKLAERLARDATLGRPISHLTLADLVEPVPPPQAEFDIRATVADLADPSSAQDLVSDQPDVVFHLAAVVSGEAERDFDKGYRLNVDGTRHLLEAVRTVGSDYHPRLVFSSSIAVFGPPFPEVIGDDHLAAPLTSYGTQKAIAELFVSDYTRRGFLDGVSIRLPTICVRPGEPNLAASGFFSSIIREPLTGQEAVLPVPDDIRHWFASPRSAAGFLVHAARVDGDALGDRRALTMPGVSATVGEMIESLRRIAGTEAVELIRRVPDEATLRIVASWPGRFDTRRARELGFEAETDFDDIIRAHVEDELDGVGAVAA
jgi:nucleoside-diphosphate-sugar epimerase